MVLLVFLLLLPLLASTATDAKSPLLRQKPRKLQNPCAIPYENVVLNTPNGHFFIPSYVETCLSSLIVNDTLMTYHITDLQATFRQFHAFYNVANDPAATTPGNFQEELGYTLYSGPLEGQVNMHQEFSSLIKNVSTSGASLAAFWDINAAIDKLQDAHTTPVQIAGVAGKLVWLNFLCAFAERTLVGINGPAPLSGTWTPSYNDMGEMELVVTFIEPDGSETNESIIEINGMTPYEWYYDLVSKPNYFWSRQSIGARMNVAFAEVKPKYETDSFSIPSFLRPSTFLPDSFIVKYASGTEELFFVGFEFQLLNASIAYSVMNSMPEVFDEPGSAFLNFAYLAVTASTVTGEVGVVRDLQPAPKIGDLLAAKPNVKAGHRGDKNAFEFDEVITIPNANDPGTEVQVAFSIEDDFAVLKIPDFEIYRDFQGDHFTIVEIWSNLVS